MKGECLSASILWHSGPLFIHPSLAVPLLTPYALLFLGSTMDAMSDAVDNSDVVLYGVSRAYKESANVK